MSNQHYFKASFYALGAAVLAVSVAAASFFILEPRMGLAQSNISTFTISQVIGDEISFTLPADNVSMVGTLNGLTGGTANGSTTVAVRTNAPNGYNMSIRFATTSYPGAVMVADNNPGSAIHDYRVTGGVPTYSFDTSSTSAVFGYTVAAPASFLADLAQSFLHNGSNACNEPGGSTANATNTCWMQPLLSNFEIVNRDSSATAGATTTIHFRVHVPDSPTPGLVADTYTATATLTALNNP